MAVILILDQTGHNLDYYFLRLLVTIVEICVKMIFKNTCEAQWYFCLVECHSGTNCYTVPFFIFLPHIIKCSKVWKKTLSKPLSAKTIYKFFKMSFEQFNNFPTEKNHARVLFFDDLITCVYFSYKNLKKLFFVLLQTCWNSFLNLSANVNISLWDK